MTSSLPEMCNPSVFDSKEVFRQKVLNIDQELIVKSVLNSPSHTNSEPRTKADSVYWDSELLCP